MLGLSMRALEEGMDSLLRASRLPCSVCVSELWTRQCTQRMIGRVLISSSSVLNLIFDIEFYGANHLQTFAPIR
jgi:hypothetical protein